MSYVRCLGNPERIYAWHDVDGDVYVSSPAEDLLVIPHVTFTRLFLKWDRWVTDLSYRGAKLVEEPGFGRWTLSYAGKSCTAWEVTWAYVSRSVLEEWKRV